MLEGQPLGLTGGLKLLGNSKDQLRATLRHPLVPLFVQRRLLPLLDDTSALSDEEYARLVKEHSALPGYNLEDLMIAREIEATQAWYLPQIDQSHEGIIVRSRYLAEDSLARYFCAELLAEQLPYALAVSGETPLTDLHDNSIALRPFRERQQMFQQLQEWRGTFFDDHSSSAMDQFIAVHKGFRTSFSEVLGSNNRRRYPFFQAQFSLERARAGIIQTILEAIYYGMNTQPRLTPADQFNVGRLVLLNNIQTIPPAYLREADALNFLDVYFEGVPLKVGIVKVFEGLSRKTADEFVEGLTDAGRAILNQIAASSNEEGEILQAILDDKRPSHSQN